MTLIVNVSVPATTANLGPGFDCLGLALALCNQVTLEVAQSGLTVSVSGEGADSLPADASNLVVRAAERLFTIVGRRPGGYHIRQENKIPVSSGLGSSAAAVLGGLLAANAAVDSPLGQLELLELATEIEGHPDNVTPALLGGLTMTLATEGGLVIEHIPIPDQRVAVVLPEFALSTRAARQALPDKIPLADAVFNVGRVGLLVRALETGDFGKFAIAMEDRLHQPYRLPLIPGAEEALRAGRDAGAAAVVLSGAGPSVVAFAADRHDQIVAAMGKAFRAKGLRYRSWLLSLHSQGCAVELLSQPKNSPCG
jgi:homoserine kinase